jgi:hypothetical protein
MDYTYQHKTSQAVFSVIKKTQNSFLRSGKYYQTFTADCLPRQIKHNYYFFIYIIFFETTQVLRSDTQFPPILPLQTGPKVAYHRPPWQDAELVVGRSPTMASEWESKALYLLI